MGNYNFSQWQFLNHKKSAVALTGIAEVMGANPIVWLDGSTYTGDDPVESTFQDEVSENWYAGMGAGPAVSTQNSLSCWSSAGSKEIVKGDGSETPIQISGDNSAFTIFFAGTRAADDVISGVFTSTTSDGILFDDSNGANVGTGDGIGVVIDGSNIYIGAIVWPRDAALHVLTVTYDTTTGTCRAKLDAGSFVDLTRASGSAGGTMNISKLMDFTAFGGSWYGKACEFAGFNFRSSDSQATAGNSLLYTKWGGA